MTRLATLLPYFRARIDEVSYEFACRYLFGGRKRNFPPPSRNCWRPAPAGSPHSPAGAPPQPAPTLPGAPPPPTSMAWPPAMPPTGWLTCGAARSSRPPHLPPPKKKAFRTAVTSSFDAVVLCRVPAGWAARRRGHTTSPLGRQAPRAANPACGPCMYPQRGMGKGGHVRLPPMLLSAHLVLLPIFQRPCRHRRRPPTDGLCLSLGHQPRAGTCRCAANPPSTAAAAATSRPAI